MSPIVIGIIILCLLGLLYLLQGHRISGFQDQTVTNNPLYDSYPATTLSGQDSLGR